MISKLNRRRASVDLDGDWMAHTDAVPEGGIPLGTVSIQDMTGALIRVEAPDPESDAPEAHYLMITADGFVHRLNTRKIRAALHHAGNTDPADPHENNSC
jgi:hypothetical protein